MNSQFLNPRSLAGALVMVFSLGFLNVSLVADQILSLPMYPELNKKEIVYVCDTIKNFYINLNNFIL